MNLKLVLTLCLSPLVYSFEILILQHINGLENVLNLNTKPKDSSVESHETKYSTQNDYLKTLFEELRERELLHGRKRVLVKRILPHGVETQSLEYDSKYNTYFKPIVKIHKINTVKDSENDKKKINGVRLNGNLLDYIGEIFNEQHGETLHVKLPKSFKNKEKFDRILKRVAHKLHAHKSNPKLRRIKSKELRTMSRAKSGEQHDPYRPKSPTNLDQKATDQDTKSNVAPWYSFYDYWVYNKPVHIDLCPADQIYYQGVCLYAPPH